MRAEHMNVTLPPEGDAIPTPTPATPEELSELEDQEEQQFLKDVQRATTEEELADVLERYLKNHQN